ncbi:MAG: RidA family protein [Haliscomenobacter sp.]|nr:RidA family protein [Haliscomenobacter sp.]
MEYVSTSSAPAPGGHYSQAVVHNGLIFVAGQLPIRPDGEKCLGSIEEQTVVVLANLKSILEAADSSLEKVLKTTVYVADIELWGRVNAVYARVFGEHKPARAVVPVPELHYGFLIEVEAVAHQ